MLKPRKIGTRMRSRWSACSADFKMAEEFIVQYSVQSNPSYTTNLALFTDVTNSSELRQLIIQGKIEAALLNASMVRSFHLYIY